MSADTKRIKIGLGDITRIEVDAIVNAANSSLMGGGGVDGAIHRQGVPEILAACKELRRTKLPNGLPVSQACITPAGKLKARYVIHTVGPKWRGGHSGEDEELTACYRNCLQLAREYKLQSIAFPAISTGIYGYPFKEASKIALSSVIHYLEKHNTPATVFFILFESLAESVFREVAQQYFRTCPFL